GDDPRGPADETTAALRLSRTTHARRSLPGALTDFSGASAFLPWPTHRGADQEVGATHRCNDACDVPRGCSWRPTRGSARRGRPAVGLNGPVDVLTDRG